MTIQRAADPILALSEHSPGVRALARRAWSIPDKCDPLQSLWTWGYEIEILNDLGTPVTVIGRHWKIQSQGGREETVSSAGIMGKQPVIDPGCGLIYKSGTPLPAPSGTMLGFFTVQEANKSLREVAVALALPQVHGIAENPLSHAYTFTKGESQALTSAIESYVKTPVGQQASISSEKLGLSKQAQWHLEKFLLTSGQEFGFNIEKQGYIALGILKKDLDASIPEYDIAYTDLFITISGSAFGVTLTNSRRRELPQLPEGMSWPNEKYSERRDRGEDIVQFLDRVWRPIIQTRLITQQVLRLVDSSALDAMNNYTRKHPKTGKRLSLPQDLYIPSLKEANDAALAAGPEAIAKDPRLAQVFASRVRQGIKIPGF